MSSRTLMPSRREHRWHAAMSLAGAAVWAALATLAGMRRAHFGVIELLFQFAPLVIVPLGMHLADDLAVSPPFPPAKWRLIVLFPAALSASASFWLPPGRVAGALSAVWLLYAVLVGSEQFGKTKRMLLSLAYFDLIFGAAWLVISRSGLRPLGFQEPIILLTAVHFHYSGFATALIASATLHEFERKRMSLPGLPQLVWLIVLLPFVVAAGFVFSPLLRMVSTIALSTCVTALAMILWWLAKQMESTAARIYMRCATSAATVAFSLAGLYALGEYSGKEWINVPGMANSHGVLNALGFVLLSLLAWVIACDSEQHAPTNQKRETHVAEFSNTRGESLALAARRSSAGFSFVTSAQSIPEFVARDFYDR
jgi:hypothetical protein